MPPPPGAIDPRRNVLQAHGGGGRPGRRGLEEGRRLGQERLGRVARGVQVPAAGVLEAAGLDVADEHEQPCVDQGVAGPAHADQVLHPRAPALAPRDDVVHLQAVGAAAATAAVPVPRQHPRAHRRRDPPVRCVIVQVRVDHARVARERLVAQTERSRELADELTQIVSRIIRRYTSTVPSAALLKETSVPAGSVPHPTQGTTARRTDAPNVQQALASMRESLSDLRSLARNTVEDPNGSSDESTELPAARLADQVENLLKIIGPHGSPANSGSGACSEATTAKTQANR